MLNKRAGDLRALYQCIKAMNLTMQPLKQSASVIYLDQAMYAISQKIIWANREELQEVVLMMGGFHLSINFWLRLKAYFFGNLGWKDLLVDAGIFTVRVAEGLLDAKRYSRTLDAYLAVYEAL